MSRKKEEYKIKTLNHQNASERIPEDSLDNNTQIIYNRNIKY